MTLEQSERLRAGEDVPEADPDDARKLLYNRKAFDLVAEEETHNLLYRSEKKAR